MTARQDIGPAAAALARRSQAASTLRLLRRIPASCRGSLRLSHTDEDCPSARAFQTGRVQKQLRWPGRVRGAVESVPMCELFGDEDVRFEYFRDVTGERRLKAALTRQGRRRDPWSS